MTPIDDHVGAYLKARRTELNMSEADVARALALEPRIIQDYECGAQRVPAKHLQILCDLYDISPRDLLRDAPTHPEPANDSASPL